jgi:1-aminocyclopropane-1-carboxylate deaminase
LEGKGISLFLKREDLLHPFVSGNKFRKLKYNLLEIRSLGLGTLLTFGGAYSNHIAATAYAGREAGLRTVGIIRGDELQHSWEANPTLRFAKAQGMHLKFISRKMYGNKNDASFLMDLEQEFGTCYILPEGGTNLLAVKGCGEILGEGDRDFNVICCAVGTGGTIAGIVNASHGSQRVLGFPALKGGFLKEDICKFAQRENWELMTDYHFGGYGKIDSALVNFINGFRETTQISLDPLYTGKMMFGILDLINKDQFVPGTRILAIHTGGLQGITGMNTVLKRKKLPLIAV